MQKIVYSIIILLIFSTSIFSKKHNHKHMKVNDPVCNRVIESTHTKYKTLQEGEQYWFCSKECFKDFMKNPLVYRNIVKSRQLFKRQKKQEALLLLENQLKKSSKNRIAAGEYNFMLGYLKSMAGKAEETVKHWEEVINRYPLKTKISYTSINCATIYLNYLNKPQKAVAILETAMKKGNIESKPHLKTALKTLKKAYMKMGKNQKAAEIDKKLKKVK